MPIGKVVFVFDWALECQCDAGPRVSGHLQISLESLLESGKLFYDVVIHLESVRREAEEVAEELGLEKAPDELLIFEVTTTIIHESIHCAIQDAFVTAEDVEELVRNRIYKGYFEELVVEALAY